MVPSLAFESSQSDDLHAGILDMFGSCHSLRAAAGNWSTQAGTWLPRNRPAHVTRCFTITSSHAQEARQPQHSLLLYICVASH